MRLIYILATMYALLALSACAKPVTAAAASGVEGIGLAGDSTATTLSDAVTLSEAVTAP